MTCVVYACHDLHNSSDIEVTITDEVGRVTQITTHVTYVS